MGYITIEYKPGVVYAQRTGIESVTENPLSGTEQVILFQADRIAALEDELASSKADGAHAFRLLRSVSETCKRLEAELAAVKSENERLNEKLKWAEKDYDSLRAFVQKNGITND